MLATELRDAFTVFMLTWPQSPVNDPGGVATPFEPFREVFQPRSAHVSQCGRLQKALNRLRYNEPKRPAPQFVRFDVATIGH